MSENWDDLVNWIVAGLWLATVFEFFMISLAFLSYTDVPNSLISGIGFWGAGFSLLAGFELFIYFFKSLHRRSWTGTALRSMAHEVP